MFESEQLNLLQPLATNGSRHTFGAQIVSGLLLRGDSAMRRGRWEEASHCFIGAYFCDGGVNLMLRAKVELARLLHGVDSDIAQMTQICDAPQRDDEKLQWALDRLRIAAAKLDWIQEKLPQTHPITTLRQRLDAALIRATELAHGQLMRTS